MALNIKNKWIKRLLLTCLSVLLIAGGLIVGFGVRETRRQKSISEKLYHEREEKFKATPNVIDGLALLQKSWKRQEYKKTINYAEYCTKVGVDTTDLGWLVHLLMASAQSKTGNPEGACSEANLAVRLAQRDRIPDERLKEYGLKELLDNCNKEKAKP
jgi:hypothetical protein